MKRKINLLILLAGAALQACFNNDDADLGKKDRENDQEIQGYIAEITKKDSKIQVQSTDKGLYYYKTLDSPQNRVPKTGEQVFVHYTGRLLKDTTSIFDDSRKRNRPLVFALNGGQLIPGFNDGVAQMREGEKAVLLIPSRLGYGSSPLKNIPAYSNLRFNVELIKTRTQEEALGDFAKDTVAKANKLVLNTTDTTQYKRVPDTESTFYVQLQPGTGATVTAGKQVSVKYRGIFLDGTSFDPVSSSPATTSTVTSTDNFTYSQTGRIRGYVQGIGQMKVGEKGYLFIHSRDGYGESGSPRDTRGNQVIPPNTPLIFYIEVVSVQ